MNTRQKRMLQRSRPQKQNNWLYVLGLIVFLLLLGVAGHFDYQSQQLKAASAHCAGQMNTDYTQCLNHQLNEDK